ncbi:MAG: DUF2804 family protein [Desulfobacterales bacterium]
MIHGPSHPWTGKSISALRAKKHRAENINAGLIATRFTQLMGNLSGTLTTDTGEKIILKDCPGWAEDHYAKW